MYQADGLKYITGSTAAQDIRNTKSIAQIILNIYQTHPEVAKPLYQIYLQLINMGYINNDPQVDAIFAPQQLSTFTNQSTTTTGGGISPIVLIGGAALLFFALK